MKTDIEIVRGTTNTFEILVKDALDVPYVLSTNEKLLFGVKKNPKDSEYIFVKTVTVGENGVYTVVVKPEDTENCDYGRYFYDVGIQSESNYFNVIEASIFHIKENITYWGCDV